MSVTTEHVDVLIVGAGLSGVGAAWRLQEQHPGKTYTILEARDAIGGTWDLFRYPGIRSDSDMYTLSFPFRPWTNRQAIADGAHIRQYIRDTASEAGIDEHIRFGHRVRSAAWSSDDARWTVTAQVGKKSVTLTASFLYLCSGYYSYDSGFQPDFPGLESFEGQLVHPQFWPEDLDYAGKKVVVIGSGATAVTLIPSMADDAGHVTMLQRSPTYITSLPGEDKLAQLTLKTLPDGVGHTVNRARMAATAIGFYQFCRRFPKAARAILLKRAKAALPEGYDMSHFTPSYNPWDQRLCIVPNGDLFKAIRRGKASVVTDTIKSFDATGIRLDSGEHLEADIVVSATGLNVVTFGTIELSVDGEKVDTSQVYAYKGVMFSGLPNLAWCVGYTNASWSLRADLSHQYVMQFLKHLDDNGYAYGMPDPAGASGERPLLDLTSGYVQRALAVLPKQGDQRPWTVRQNWMLDSWDMRNTDVTEAMVFRTAQKASVGAA
ncbi:MAG TPA: NAD(P)/FAD-dependent oxidoreductase [Aeromicrobium sp.]|nr:NAD(P)/FAD-dependent oxidoreductase [Aeromicrobium sp.]